MNKAESKYYNTAIKMDEAFLELLNKKKFEFITIKEICEKAGVNRSTFYLHYESTNDLLIEAGEYINNKFFSYFAGTDIETVEISSLNNEDLNFVKPKYLIPWLKFIKDNKILFKTIIKRFKTLALFTSYNDVFGNIIKPVLQRLIPNETERSYILMFYVEGIIAIVKEWIKNDCEMDVEEISNIISNCVNR